MNTLSVPKTCLTCSKTIRGRSDKKFCDDFCRNSFNNQLKSDRNNLVRNINAVLRKNRRILEELIDGKEEMVKASREKLLQLGFEFNHFTHTCTNKKGSTHYFCYEFGYLPVENNFYLIVKKKEE